MAADKKTYLLDIVNELRTKWPDNRTVNIVCHGHSVPSGYFLTPMVDTFNAYPHLLHKAIKEKFPFAVVNVIISAIGGENSNIGYKRFKGEVLNHNPDIVTIDYGLNDRGLNRQKADKAWEYMIENALKNRAKVILLTPSLDITYNNKDEGMLYEQTLRIRKLADKFDVALADSYKGFTSYIDNGGALFDLLSQSNHPCRLGHEIIAREIMKYFPMI